MNRPEPDFEHARRPVRDGKGLHPAPSGAGLRWQDVYREAELYKAAVRVYTKGLFQWRKALFTSTDGRTLYDLAGHGLRSLDALHHSLRCESFEFRPAAALDFNFNGKRRRLYISPWEERIVDYLLYRVLNRKLHRWFSPNTYAYRDRTNGLDRCQARITRVLREAKAPLYLVKRDIADYFASIDHEILLDQLARLVEPEDYLFKLLEQRVRFRYRKGGEVRTAPVGIPFGSAAACLFANIHLTALDRRMEAIGGAKYFRYADDCLLLTPDRGAAALARDRLERGLAEMRLRVKASHRADLVIAQNPIADPDFNRTLEFRHLGLLFRAGGVVALSRDKLRKVRNLFRFAFRRGRRRWTRIVDPREKARALVAIARETLERGVRNVAIVDYYLKHVSEETQIRLLDRWLAEEVLSLVFGGHKKGHFRRISFGELRAFGLPSLVHRRRLIRRRKIESPFFIWQRQKAATAFRGTVARLGRHLPQAGDGAGRAFSPIPEAAASPSADGQVPVREGGCLSMGVMEDAGRCSVRRRFTRPSL